jgi:hypothetical protein
MSKTIGVIILLGWTAALLWHQNEVGHYRYVQGCVQGVNGVVESVAQSGVLIQSSTTPKDWCEEQYKLLK